MMIHIKKSRGFTLIEIMVVVIILGILATIIIPRVMSRPEEARVVKAKQDIMAIENALDLYKLDNNIYPTTQQGLKALVEKPNSDPVPNRWKTGGYLKSLPKDPWGNPYQYSSPGKHGEIDIYSYGPSGENLLGQENQTEIGNWNTGQEQ